MWDVGEWRQVCVDKEFGGGSQAAVGGHVDIGGGRCGLHRWWWEVWAVALILNGVGGGRCGPWMVVW